MRRPGFAQRPWLAALALGALLCLAAAACSEDGVTPNCPSVGLYDVRTIGNDAAAGAGGAAEEAAERESERQAAVDAGCQTDIYRAGSNE